MKQDCINSEYLPAPKSPIIGPCCFCPTVVFVSVAFMCVLLTLVAVSIRFRQNTATSKVLLHLSPTARVLPLRPRPQTTIKELPRAYHNCQRIQVRINTYFDIRISSFRYSCHNRIDIIVRHYTCIRHIRHFCNDRIVRYFRHFSHFIHFCIDRTNRKNSNTRKISRVEVIVNLAKFQIYKLKTYSIYLYSYSKHSQKILQLKLENLHYIQTKHLLMFTQNSSFLKSILCQYILFSSDNNISHSSLVFLNFENWHAFC